MRLPGAAFIFSLWGATSLWAAPDQVGWIDLIDQSAQTYDDPYRDLMDDQLQDLIAVVQLRDAVGKTSDNADAKAQLADKETALKGAGVDIDWLIDQRWIVAERRVQAASAGNQELDGQIVTLAGYAIPARPDADGTPTAYLVPERGMCSHTPPPNPNQMIRVRLMTGWMPTALHEPVRLTGTLVIEPTEQVMQVVDGMQLMRATFRMDAQQVETAADMRANSKPADQNAWVRNLAESLRASGVLPENEDASE